MAPRDDAPSRAVKLRRDAIARWENEGGLALPPPKPDEDHALGSDEAGHSFP